MRKEALAPASPPLSLHSMFDDMFYSLLDFQWSLLIIIIIIIIKDTEIIFLKILTLFFVIFKRKEKERYLIKKMAMVRASSPVSKQVQWANIKEKGEP